MAAFAAARNVSLVVKPGRIRVGDGAYIEVDAATEDRSLVVEAYARQGQLKGSQPKKIAQDILKLALLKRQAGYERTETIIVFASQEAHNSISGWLQRAAAEFGVGLAVVSIPEETQDKIRDAQRRQVMVNLEQVSDDVASPDIGWHGSV